MIEETGYKTPGLIEFNPGVLYRWRIITDERPAFLLFDEEFFQRFFEVQNKN